MIGVTSPAQCCCDPPTNICIRLVTYRFLCCEQRTFLYVNSPCVIDAIRINGTSITVSGTSNQFGGHPASAPVINIGDEPITGVLLASTGDGCCPSLILPSTASPYAISVAAVSCTYVVEVDTCGATYSCSITYCLPRNIVFAAQTLGPFVNSDTCSIETDLGTSTRTISNDLGAINIPEFGIDFCIADEDGMEYDLGSWSATVTTVTTVGLNTTTVVEEYDGTLALWVPPYEQCEMTSGTSNITLQFLFTGTRTTTTTTSMGTFVSTVTFTNLVIGAIAIVNCNDPTAGFAELIFCAQQGPPIIPDSLVCRCEENVTFDLITSWC